MSLPSEEEIKAFDRAVFLVTELLKGYIERDDLDKKELLEIIEHIQVDIFQVKQEKTSCNKLN
jgi:hypothetical protein